MTLTLAQLVPIVSSAVAAAMMVRLGRAKSMLVVRRPRRCAACGVARAQCKCAL